jgi:hypothetical protein
MAGGFLPEQMNFSEECEMVELERECYMLLASVECVGLIYRYVSIVCSLKSLKTR